MPTSEQLSKAEFKQDSAEVLSSMQRSSPHHLPGLFAVCQKNDDQRHFAAPKGGLSLEHVAALAQSAPVFCSPSSS